MNQATSQFIREHRNDDVHKLALSNPSPSVGLRGTSSDGLQSVDLMVALTQIEGYQTAVHKLPSWTDKEGILWPRKLSLEQCSSEATAKYKHDLVERLLQSLTPEERQQSRMADITGGLGVDFAAISSLFTHATYVERQPELCQLAQNNFAILGLNNTDIVCGDALADGILSARAPYTLLYIDPARRDTAGRKVALIEDCSPDVCSMQDLLAKLTRLCIIKLSPMLDITAALRAMRYVREVHVVGYQGECKELLLVIDYASNSEEIQGAFPTIHCIDLPLRGITGGCFVFTRTDEEQTPLILAEKVCQYLYEPSPALLKAGAYKLIAKRYGLSKLAPMTHLYTSETLLPEFPGRTWQVIDTCSFAKHDLRRMLAGIDRAELSVRGFPISVAQLRKQLKLKEGGTTHLIATTISDGRKLLIKTEYIHASK